jgi:hypothetical protein
MNRKYEFKIHISTTHSFFPSRFGEECFYFWLSLLFLPDDEKALA